MGPWATMLVPSISHIKSCPFGVLQQDVCLTVAIESPVPTARQLGPGLATGLWATMLVMFIF
jgi:hypothetical protein